MPNNPPPLVSFIIVNWNTRARLRACVDSVRATCTTFLFEIVVVDNGSTDGSAEWLRAAYPEIVLIANTENVGFARANNQALAACAGEFALLLNSDAQLMPETMTHLLQVMQQEPRAAAAAPMLLNADHSFQAGPNDDLTLWSETLHACGMARFFRGGNYPGHGAAAPRGAYAWVSGACMLLRRAAWEQVGTLDADYFMYTEEADWCWRARQAGWTIWYEPLARVVHLGGGSSRNASAKMRAALYESKLIFFQKHRPRWQTRALRAILLVTSSAKIVYYSLAAQIERAHAQALRERASSFRLVFQKARTFTLTHPRLENSAASLQK